MNNNNNNNNIDRGCITIGRMAPDFTALSTDGVITLSQFRGKWVILMSEPSAFGAVSTSSLVELSKLHDEFEKRNVEVLVLTLDNNFANIEWKHSILADYGIIVKFPILEDKDKKIADLYNIVNPDRIYEQSVRDLFIINPTGRISAIATYPISVGRNFYETLRVIDSLQLTENYGVYTPSNWMPGNPVIIPTAKTFEESMNRLQNNMDMNCMNWYECYTEYYSLISNNNQANLTTNCLKK